MATDSTRKKRLATVREHIQAEVEHRFDDALATFGRVPRYELVATGETIKGPKAVAAYYEETRRAFPDQTPTPLHYHEAEDAILVEFLLSGTHLGPYRGLPPTGRSFSVRMCAVFEFEGEELICERVYFDAGSIQRQLGIARDPMGLWGRVTTVANHPVTISRAIIRQVTGR